MKATKCYKTSDDKIHEDKAQARRRQAELDLLAEMGPLVHPDADATDFAMQAISGRKQFIELFRAEDALNQKSA